MKQKRHYSVIASLMLLAGLSLATLTTSCSKDGGEERGEAMGMLEPETGYSMSGGEKSGAAHSDTSLDGFSGEGGMGGEDSEPQNGNSEAGIVTAAEWNDLAHWDFWAALLQKEDFKDKSDYWKFYTDNRVAVKVTD